MGRAKSCYSMREFSNLCRILRPLQGYNRAFCRNVGISRISCTFPSQKSDDSTPPMPNFHVSWVTPRNRPLLTGYYTTWQNQTKPFKFCYFSPSFSIWRPLIMGECVGKCGTIRFSRYILLLFVTWCRGLTPSDRGCRILVTICRIVKIQLRNAFFI